MTLSGQNFVALLCFAAIFSLLLSVLSGTIYMAAEALLVAVQAGRANPNQPTSSFRHGGGSNFGRHDWGSKRETSTTGLRRLLNWFWKALFLSLASAAMTGGAICSFCSSLDTTGGETTSCRIVIGVGALFAAVVSLVISPAFIDRPRTDNQVPIAFGTTGRARRPSSRPHA